MEIHGRGGAIRVGPYTAARVGAWTLSRGGDIYTVVAEIVQPDAYWLTQEPTQMAFAVGARSWVWSQPRLSVTGATVTGELHGPPETR